MSRKLAICCIVCALLFGICGGVVLIASENKMFAICLFLLSAVFLVLPDFVGWRKTRYINLLLDVNNPKLTKNILDKLSRDKNWYICLLVAVYPKTTEDILERLAKHKDWNVRLGVLRNQKTSDFCVAELCKDKELFVREVAKQELAKRREKKEENI